MTQILKFLNFQQLLKCILRASLCLGEKFHYLWVRPLYFSALQLSFRTANWAGESSYRTTNWSGRIKLQNCESSWQTELQDYELSFRTANQASNWALNARLIIVSPSDGDPPSWKCFGAWKPSKHLSVTDWLRYTLILQEVLFFWIELYTYKSASVYNSVHIHV